MNSNCDFSCNIILYGRTTFYEIVGVEIVAVYLTIYICLNIQAFEHIYNEHKNCFSRAINDVVADLKRCAWTA